MTDEREVQITIVETIHYYRDVPLSRLEEIAGLTFEEDCEGDMQTFLEAVQEGTTQHEGFAEWMERYADVQGQVWKGKFKEVASDG